MCVCDTDAVSRGGISWLSVSRAWTDKPGKARKQEENWCNHSTHSRMKHRSQKYIIIFAIPLSTCALASFNLQSFRCIYQGLVNTKLLHRQSSVHKKKKKEETGSTQFLYSFMYVFLLCEAHTNTHSWCLSSAWSADLWVQRRCQLWLIHFHTRPHTGLSILLHTSLTAFVVRVLDSCQTLFRDKSSGQSCTLSVMAAVDLWLGIEGEEEWSHTGYRFWSGYSHCPCQLLSFYGLVTCRVWHRFTLILAYV